MATLAHAPGVVDEIGTLLGPVPFERRRAVGTDLLARYRGILRPCRRGGRRRALWKDAQANFAPLPADMATAIDRSWRGAGEPGPNALVSSPVRRPMERSVVASCTWPRSTGLTDSSNRTVPATSSWAAMLPRSSTPPCSSKSIGTAVTTTSRCKPGEPFRPRASAMRMPRRRWPDCWAIPGVQAGLPAGVSQRQRGADARSMVHGDRCLRADAGQPVAVRRLPARHARRPECGGTAGACGSSSPSAAPIVTRGPASGAPNSKSSVSSATIGPRPRAPNRPTKGRFEVTHKDDDLYVFKVPILLTLPERPPTFTTDRWTSLADAVAVMAKVQPDVTLAEADLRSIVAFLECLTGSVPRALAKLRFAPGRIRAVPPASRAASVEQVTAVDRRRGIPTDSRSVSSPTADSGTRALPVRPGCSAGNGTSREVDPGEQIFALPSRTGRTARCSSSIRPASRYCRTVATPPPKRISRSPAAAWARSNAAWMPSLTK